MADTARKNDRQEHGWTMTEADKILAKEILNRLPAQIFDIHMHPYRVQDIDPCPKFVMWGPKTANLRTWRKKVGEQVGQSRLSGALCTPYPSRHGNINAVNDFIVKQVEKEDHCRANIVVSIDYPREKVEAYLANPKVVGFKPYHLYSKRKKTFDSDIGEYLPEWVWEIGNERRLLILLHMVKDLALADPANQKSIRRLCQKYPNVTLILAHAARSFHASNTVKGISSMRGLENVWFDTSAICEPEAIIAILREFGPRKVLWGSDFPVSQQRGRCVAIGSGFAWITTDQVEWNDTAFFGQPVLAGIESLRAALNAADQIGLNDDDLQDIFCDNALRLLGIKKAPGNTTQDLYRDAKQIIPGGVQLLSKRPEMSAPEQWPAYFREARGCETWDMDGRHYYDVSTTGIGACLLGFRDPDVTRAVQRRLTLGSFCTLNSPEEVELARLLCELHPWAEQARFARTGGEAMSAAVRIARATTDRSAIAVCGYHGWHDWYLAANLGDNDSLRGHLLPGLAPFGVPRELRGTTFAFTYNDRDEFQKIIDEHGDRLAAVVMEPCRYHDPEPGFLEFVRDETHKVGAKLIFDEITIGWRLTLGGAHLRLGVTPDIAVFAKAISNGHPMAAIIGTRDAMEGANVSFISSTYWTEGIGLTAALATIKKMQHVNLPAHCKRIGIRVQDAWRTAGKRYGLPIEVDNGFPVLAHFAFKRKLAQELKTLYVQMMLEQGFLAGLSIYVTLAHTDEIIDKYVATINEVFAEIADTLTKGDVKKRLKGPVAHTGFRRLL